MRQEIFDLLRGGFREPIQAFFYPTKQGSTRKSGAPAQTEKRQSLNVRVVMMLPRAVSLSDKQPTLVSFSHCHSLSLSLSRRCGNTEDDGACEFTRKRSRHMPACLLVLKAIYHKYIIYCSWDNRVIKVYFRWGHLTHFVVLFSCTWPRIESSNGLLVGRGQLTKEQTGREGKLFTCDFRDGLNCFGTNELG